MHNLSISRSIASRAVHLKFTPRTTSLKQTSAFLRLLNLRFGDVEHFKDLQYDADPKPGQILTIFRTIDAAKGLTHASPLKWRVEIGGGVHGEGVVACALGDEPLDPDWESRRRRSSKRSRETPDSEANYRVLDALDMAGLDQDLPAQTPSELQNAHHERPLDAFDEAGFGNETATTKKPRRADLSALSRSRSQVKLSRANLKQSVAPRKEPAVMSEELDRPDVEPSPSFFNIRPLDSRAVHSSAMDSQPNSLKSAFMSLLDDLREEPPGTRYSRPPRSSSPADEDTDPQSNASPPRPSPPDRTQHSTSNPSTQRRSLHSTASLARPATFPPRGPSPLQPKPGTVLEFDIVAYPASHNFEIDIQRGRYWGSYALNRQTPVTRDLQKRVPLPGLADLDLKREGRQWRRVLEEREKVMRGRRTLREVWEEARKHDRDPK